MATHRVVLTERLLRVVAERQQLELFDWWLQEGVPLRQQLHRLLEDLPWRRDVPEAQAAVTASLPSAIRIRSDPTHIEASEGHCRFAQ